MARARRREDADGRMTLTAHDRLRAAFGHRRPGHRHLDPRSSDLSPVEYHDAQPDCGTASQSAGAIAGRGRLSLGGLSRIAIIWALGV
jgi:hypothetical protein